MLYLLLFARANSGDDTPNKTFMSTEIFGFPNRINDNPNVRNSKQSVVRSEREKLHDYVRRVISEQRLSYRVVSQRSGGRISATTISDIINQRVKDIRTETLLALAHGLGVPEEEVLAAASGKPAIEESVSEDTDPTRKTLEKLPLKFDRTIPGLPADKRVNVAALIELLDRELDRLNRERDK